MLSLKRLCCGVSLQLNNDLQNKNGSYRANMVSLNKLVLVEATEDTVVYPYQSEQFGGYEWGTTVRAHPFCVAFVTMVVVWFCCDFACCVNYRVLCSVLYSRLCDVLLI